MKKVMIVAAVALVFGMVGCSKKVDCKCTITQTMDGEVVGTSEATYNDVEGSCDDVKIDQQMIGYSATLNCKEI